MSLLPESNGMSHFISIWKRQVEGRQQRLIGVAGFGLRNRRNARAKIVKWPFTYW